MIITWLVYYFLIVTVPINCSEKTIDSFTHFAQKSHKKSALWHTQKAKSSTEKFHDRFQNFLILFLDRCKTVNTQEQLAQGIMTLSLIKQYQPNIFKRYQLQDLLIECFKQAQNFTATESMHLFELQPYFDYWYFSQISHSGIYPELSSDILKRIFTSSASASMTDPVAALVMVNYLTMLKTCNVTFYKRHKKYIPSLKKVIKKDTVTQGYLLVCQFFYQNVKELDRSYFEELAYYCSKTVLKEQPLDLIAQLYACCRLADHIEPSIAKDLAIILNKRYPESFQEICAFTLAACQ